MSSGQLDILKRVTQNHGFIGAGVLLFAIPESNPESVYILLGQEGSNKFWCDFGGRTKSKESAFETAGREFTEESMACVSGELNDVYQTRTMLEQAKYLTALVWSVGNFKRSYALFVKQIDFDPELPLRFEETRKLLRTIADQSSVIHYLNSAVPGCDATFPRVGMPLNNGCVVCDILDVQLGPRNSSLTVVYEVSSSFLERANSLIRTDVHKSANDIRQSNFFKYWSWFEKSKALRTLWSEECKKNAWLPSHPSVMLMSRFGQMQTVSVNKDYLEKDAISWFGLRQLRRKCRAGVAGGETDLRRCFVPLCHTVLDLFAKLGYN